MHFYHKLNLIVAGAALLGHGAEGAVDLGWYPPKATQINNLTNVLTATGVYGFIYNSSYPTDAGYGYNWCNMPHVRKQEYKKASDDYRLKYVEIIHRHHKRTPYASNSFPVESYRWDCDDQGLFFYGQRLAAKTNQSAHTYWHGYVSPTNPFTPSGFLGSCQFPQITKQGLDDSWQHGRDLYGVYHGLLEFLPKDISSRVSFRVTQNVITSQVAGMLINGIYKTQDNVQLLVAPSGYDALEPTYTCPSAVTIYNNERSTPAWNNHLAQTSSLSAILDDISGVNPTDSGWHSWFDHYYDNLSTRQCHAKPLPCKVVNGKNSTTCITQDMANEVYRLGNWEYSYIYRDSPSSLNYAVGSFGVWVAELAQNIRDFIAGKSNVIYRHNVAHDGSVSKLLSLLQIDVMVWPGMGSEVVFEVYQKTSNNNRYNNKEGGATSASGYYMRVLWGGQVLRSSSPTLGLMDMVPLENVLAYFDGFVGQGASLIKGKCSGATPY